MEKSINSIISSLYTQFILRDFFAKIIPGSILLISIISWNSDLRDANKIIYSISKIPFVVIIFVIAISWLIGLSIQSLGEFTRVITINHILENNKRKMDIDSWVYMRSLFLKKATTDEFKLRARILSPVSSAFCVENID